MTILAEECSSEAEHQVENWGLEPLHVLRHEILKGRVDRLSIRPIQWYHTKSQCRQPRYPKSINTRSAISWRCRIFRPVDFLLCLLILRLVLVKVKTLGGARDRNPRRDTRKRHVVWRIKSKGQKRVKCIKDLHVESKFKRKKKLYCG